MAGEIRPSEILDSDLKESKLDCDDLNILITWPVKSPSKY